MEVLEVKGLKKHIGNRQIIKNIDFSIKEGEIFGFLGPNGAGKTTTIRMLVGLIAPSSGNIKIAGHDIGAERERALSNVGAVVENPELYTYLSGRENLMQIARVRNIPKEDIEQIIEMVNLKERIDDKVKKYSLGMKQRLGLALALLAKPRLLILDEPTNGLDPSGILDFREIVKNVARKNGTAVFISSHMLSEVQQLCDTVAFINDGVIKSVESIEDGTIKNDTEIYTLITKDSSNTAEILKGCNAVTEVQQQENEFTIAIKHDSSHLVLKLLIENGIDVKEIFKKHQELEERYMELVEGGRRL
ncbi:ABC transporter ATP-binding protein [Clostridium oryzae]|uniref:Putative ABC transporter ATP-binding protein YxlF n=1 Tax=Clostridium oryzae TaxID=1450648 RepID=A0A1V4IC41_9CLOT|nr:ABC transporter ATP-binding protein [Clostridium oryzae]OPJ57424.1 putative ABC transporter ATP-binding protein YxlF [Clostridium oryzae]